MKTAFTLTCAALLMAGCTHIREETYGSWLDHVGDAPKTRPASAEQAAAYKAQADQLAARAEDLRIKLVAQPSRLERFEYLRELREIGDEQREAERAARFGPAPTAQPMPDPADPGA